MKIIFKNDGLVCILTASNEALETMPLEEIAAQAIPKDVKYFIVDSTTFPDAPTESWDLSDDGVIIVNQEKLAQIKIENYPMLTGRQFHMTLVMNSLEDSIQAAIDAIEDPMQRAIVNIEFNKANGYRRTGTSVIFMQKELGMPDDELNKLWEQALAIPD